jgi:2TM domain-containing protein
LRPIPGAIGWNSWFDEASAEARFLLFTPRTAPGGRAMTDPKTRDHFVDDDALRPSHDMLETAREISFSADEQEEAVAQEALLRQEQAARALHEQAVATYEALVLKRGRDRRALILHVMIFLVGGVALFAVNQAMGGSTWFPWPLLAWTLALAGHAAWVRTRVAPVPPAPLPSPADPMRAASLRPPRPRPLAGRGRDEDVDEVTRARARTTVRTTRKRD